MASLSNRPTHLKLIYSRRDQPRSISTTIPGSIHHRLRQHAIANNQTMKSLVTEALTNFLASR